MRKEKEISTNIYLDHIFYRIEIIFTSKKFLDEREMECASEYIENGHIKLHLRSKPQKQHFPSVAHEVIHCLQWIAKDRNIDFIKEEEHFAYMMQFMLNRIFEYEYKLWIK